MIDIFHFSTGFVIGSISTVIIVYIWEEVIEKQMKYYENSELDYRVNRIDRCLEYGKIDARTVRCTRKKNHEGEHVCQLSNGTVLGKF